MASVIADSTLAAFDRANRCTTTSLSVLVWKIAPSLTSASRSSPALIRLPLCPSASWPCALSITMGWALASRLSPAVE